MVQIVLVLQCFRDLVLPGDLLMLHCCVCLLGFLLYEVGSEV